MGLFRFDSTKIKIMLMPKKNLVAIYEHLFREGVMVAKKDTHAPKHPELEAVPNLQVIKALTSLKSRGYVKEQFAWRHYYWYLTNEGIGYLRNYLHLPSEIVPATLKKQTRQDQGLDQALEQAVVLETSPSTVIVMPTGGRILATKPVPPVQDQYPWNSEEALAEAAPNPNKR